MDKQVKLIDDTNVFWNDIKQKLNSPNTADKAERMAYVGDRDQWWNTQVSPIFLQTYSGIFSFPPADRFVSKETITREKVSKILVEISSRFQATKFYGPDPLAFIPYRIQLVTAEMNGERPVVKAESLISYSEIRAERFTQANRMENDLLYFTLHQSDRRDRCEILPLAEFVLSQIQALPICNFR